MNPTKRECGKPMDEHFYEYVNTPTREPASECSRLRYLGTLRDFMRIKEKYDKCGLHFNRVLVVDRHLGSYVPEYRLVPYLVPIPEDARTYPWVRGEEYHVLQE